ncbi:serine/threonine-protein kinase VIK [Cryptomeria japonica]|uniref:serine/threonine-protein kinase VIK n=1 Tax=Cryptomeria japonica TaxID=3369 RepID=UPI0027DA0320|nr:serine/threonine-protein kinase VIK [Cryptomeria japonica]
MDSENSWELIGKFLTCASKGDRIGLNKMLMEGVPPDLKDYDDRTALHLAASEGHASIVELLLEHNACVNPYDRWKRTPLADARHYDRKDICKILEAYGGECDCDSPRLESNSGYEIDHTEIDYTEKCTMLQNNDSIVEKVKWRGTWVVQTTIISEDAVDFYAQNIFEELRNLRHPNIVQFLGAVIQNQNIIILTEFLPKGSLNEMLEKKNPLDLQIALQFALDIARGMNYLHEHKPKPIVHKYLSTRNLFLNGPRHLKIGEFWWQRLKKASPTVEDDNDGTPTNHMTPKNMSNELYETKVDVLSFAHILFEMLEGHPPHSTDELCQGELKFKKSKCHKILRKLIYDCHNNDSTKRPTFSKIIADLETISNLIPKYDCMVC